MGDRGTSKRNQLPMSRNSSAVLRIAIVTGASSGIGLHTALGLARTGMRVVMTGRDRARTEAARRFVAERTRSDQIGIAVADFSSLAAVRRLADEAPAAEARPTAPYGIAIALGAVMMLLFRALA